MMPVCTSVDPRFCSVMHARCRGFHRTQRSQGSLGNKSNAFSIERTEGTFFLREKHKALLRNIHGEITLNSVHGARRHLVPPQHSRVYITISTILCHIVCYNISRSFGEQKELKLAWSSPKTLNLQFYAVAKHDIRANRRKK
jgi:hypothetical protein